MKERCTLLRVGFAFCSFLKKNLTGLKNHTFWLCFYKKGSESLFLKRRRERIALVALLKRATRTICSCCSCCSFKKSNASESFSSLFTKRAKRGICSFFVKKQGIPKKNQRANCQPCHEIFDNCFSCIYVI